MNMIVKIKTEYKFVIAFCFVIGFLIINGELIRNKYDNAQSDLKDEIFKYDKVRKIRDGLYTKLVNTETSKKSIRDSLKNSSEENRQLYRRIRSDNEKILDLTSINLSLKEQLDTTQIVTDSIVDDSTYIPIRRFGLFYPDKSDWFINYDGRIENSTIFGKWNIGQLNVKLVRTQTPAGLQRIYLSGPSWLLANDIEILSTQPMVTKDKVTRLWLGGGWYHFYDNSLRGPSFKIAIDIKRKFMIQGSAGIHFYEIGALYGL